MGFLFGIPFHHWFFGAHLVEFLDLNSTAAEAEFALGFLRRSWRIVCEPVLGIDGFGLG